MLIAKFKMGENCILRIYENSKGLRGTLYERFYNDANNSSIMEKVSSAMFYAKDRDNTIFRVMEYFGFTNSNSVQIYG